MLRMYCLLLIVALLDRQPTCMKPSLSQKQQTQLPNIYWVMGIAYASTIWMLASIQEYKDAHSSVTSPELSPCLQNGSVSNDPINKVSSYEATPDSKMAQLHGDKIALVQKPSAQKFGSNVRKTASKFRDCFNCCHCTKESCSDFAKRLFPFITILKGYSLLYDLPCDIIAGLTVGIMHIPQGMAYALLTQLPPVYGLYASFFPVLIYFFFGTSKHISVGTFAVITMMIGAVVDKGHVAWQQQELRGAIHDINIGNNITHYVGDEDISTSGAFDNATLDRIDHLFKNEHLEELNTLKVGYAMAVTFAIGVLQLILGVLNMGFLTDFLSDPFISGFTTGAAIHVFSSQIKAAFGVKVKRFTGPFKIILSYKDFFSKIDQTNLVTLSATVAAVIVLLIVREGINNRKVIKEKLRGIPIPGELLLIIVGTVLSHQFSLERDFHVEVIGHIPNGISFVKYLPNVIGDCFAIGFTAFAVSFAIAKILADKYNYTVDPNQELIAHGFSNLFGSVFSSFCSSASLSRSMVQEGVGGRTQIVSLISSSLVVVVLLTLGPLFEDLPNSILAAIIMVSLKGLFLQFGELGKLWTVARVDFTVWLVTFISTVLLDVDLGLLIGLVYNLVPILLQTQKPKSCLLGRIPETDIYVDMKLYPDAVPVPGIKIFNYNAPVYFANVESFKTTLIKETDVNPYNLKLEHSRQMDSDCTMQQTEICIQTTETWPDKSGDTLDQSEPLTGQPLTIEGQTFAIIIDGSCIPYMDSATVRMLMKMVLEYREVDIQILIGECTVELSSLLNKSGLYSIVYRRNVCATISQAVQVAQQISRMCSESLVGTDTMEPEDFLEAAMRAEAKPGASVESADDIYREDS